MLGTFSRKGIGFPLGDGAGKLKTVKKMKGKPQTEAGGGGMETDGRTEGHGDGGRAFVCAPVPGGDVGGLSVRGGTGVNPPRSEPQAGQNFPKSSVFCPDLRRGGGALLHPPALGGAPAVTAAV